MLKRLRFAIDHALKRRIRRVHRVCNRWWCISEG